MPLNRGWTTTMMGATTMSASTQRKIALLAEQFESAYGYKRTLWDRVSNVRFTSESRHSRRKNG